MADTIEVILQFERSHASGSHAWAELRYLVRGWGKERADPEARAAVADPEHGAPLLYDLYGGTAQAGLVMLPRESITIDPIAENLYDDIPAADVRQSWIATVRYGGRPVGPLGNEPVVSFDTTGGEQHITQSKQTYAYPAGAPTNNHAIGVAGDGSVEGCDVLVQVYRWTEVRYLPDELVTQEYRMALYWLKGCTNNAPFRGFAAGEVRFDGAVGTRRGQGDWEITYHYAASPNIEGWSVGQGDHKIEGINKQGWQYLWIKYRDEEVEDSGGKKHLGKVPVAVYVEEVGGDPRQPDSGGDFDLIDEPYLLV